MQLIAGGAGVPEALWRAATVACGGGVMSLLRATLITLCAWALSAGVVWLLVVALGSGAIR